MPNKILQAFEELEAYRRKLEDEKLTQEGLTPADVIREEIPVDSVFCEDVLPSKVTIQYTDLMHATMATIKFVPLLHRNLGGIMEVSSNKKHQEFIINTHSKHQIKIRWKQCGGIKRLNEHHRGNSFKVMMIFLMEISKLEEIQTHLVEDPAFNIFKLTVNRVPILKSSYKENNVRDLKHLRSIKAEMQDNYIPSTIQEKESLRYAQELISIYNSIKIPKRLNLNTGYKSKEFEKSERITVSTKKLPKPRVQNTRPKAVGTCLRITSDRTDRFDHDD